MPPYVAGIEGKALRVVDRVIVAVSTTQSNGIEVGGAVRGLILAPYTGTITFQTSFDGSTWYDLYDGGTAVTIAATVNRAYPVPATALAGKYLRVVTPVQASDLDIPFILKAV